MWPTELWVPGTGQSSPPSSAAVAIVTAGQLPASAITETLAATALAGTILVNLAVKLGITIAYGRRRARPAASALIASMIALAGSTYLAW